jgi:hypothetical protein
MRLGGVNEEIQFATDAGLKVKQETFRNGDFDVTYLDPVTGNVVMSESIYVDPLPRPY